MKKLNWQFFGICIIFAVQVMALPYIGTFSFLRPAERSIATNMGLSINSHSEAILALKTAQGIVEQIKKDKQEILNPALDKEVVEVKFKQFSHAEIILAEYENALVHHLTQQRESKDENFEQAVFELSSHISDLKTHEVKSFINNRFL